MKQATFSQHLEELIRRLLTYTAIFVIFSAIAFNFSDEFLNFLLKSVGKTIFLSVAEGFLIHIKIAFFLGFLISLPVLFYQIWAFISSALKKIEIKLMKIYWFFSFFLFLVGIAFAYFIVLPLVLDFLLSYQRPAMQAELTINSYLGFLTTLLISFGIVFELPLMIAFLTKLNIIGPGFLIKRRKFALLLIFIVAALLTPPDVVTQVLMAVPLLILYELSIILSRIIARRRQPR